MFKFENIVILDSDAMIILSRHIDVKDLIVALKKATEEIKNVFFANMSKKNTEQIKEDMEYARGIKNRDIEAAQQRIVAKIRELEESGQIAVSHRAEDELV